MKYIIVSMIVASSWITCFGTQITGYMIGTVILNTRVERLVWNKLTDSQIYNTGGVTFVYPAGYFLIPPTIQVTLMQNIPHLITETFVAEVSVNSAISTTVMVYNVIAGIVTEAVPGSVTVYLLATQDL